MTRDRRIGSLMVSRAIDTPDTHCQTHAVPLDENRRCQTCRSEMASHRPDAKQTAGRWRVDCSCGWRGPVVSLPGQGYQPWAEHFEEVR